jgi:hypothetical protein
MRGSYVPETLVLETPAPAGRLEKKPRHVRSYGDPTYSQLTRAREDTRQMRERGELRSSRFEKVANFFRRNRQ